MAREGDKKYVDAARLIYARDGEIEVDEGAAVSHGADPGAYVQAWVWVTNKEARQARKAKTVGERLDMRRT